MNNKKNKQDKYKKICCPNCNSSNITKHQTIKKCPYELAIPELKEKLNVNNKWLTLIELANQYKSI